jgi:hypothetical protein
MERNLSTLGSQTTSKSALIFDLLSTIRKLRTLDVSCSPIYAAAWKSDKVSIVSKNSSSARTPTKKGISFHCPTTLVK